MKWTDLFDKRKNLLYGGMKLSDGEINANWHLELMGSDSRMAYVIAIGSKQIPASSWNSILRTKETMYGQEYFTPGWQGGGLFMQYIAGLFIDERQTILGQSAAQFAYAQILHQKMLSCNLWGWSASVNPDGGYIGWGQITDDVITPHASILGIHFFPQEVMANLKKMDDLLLRQPVRIQDEELLLGYADAYDWKNKKMAYERLVLDQSMLFLTLTNYLLDGIIWKTFAKNKWIQNAIKEIADLRPLDGKPVYANKGFIGMQINFSERSVSISLVNDSLRDILSSSVITKVFDETTGEKVFEKIHNLELVHDGKSLSLDGVFFDKMVKKHEYYIKVEWLDLDRNKICKADLVKTL